MTLKIFYTQSIKIKAYLFITIPKRFIKISFLKYLINSKTLLNFVVPLGKRSLNYEYVQFRTKNGPLHFNVLN